MSRAIDSILIPTDGSAGSLAGANVGIALASRTGATVHVLSVVELPAVLAELEDDEATAQLEVDAEEAAETVAELATDYDDRLDVTTVVKHGTPFRCIREYANRHEVDVIAMGTRGQTGHDRTRLGCVTENLLRTTRTPVLAVPSAAGVTAIDDVAFDRLLLPTDGSHGAEIATQWGVGLAASLEASIRALHVIDTERFSGLYESDKVHDALERRAEEVLEAARERGETAGVDVPGSVETGSPVNVILRDATAVDLVVMGTHGRTGIGQWFLGSVTENVVRQAEVPVFCVPVTAGPP